MTDAPYAIRRLNFQFALDKGTFGGGLKTVSIETAAGSNLGLRADVTLEHAQLPDSSPNAVARIYGLTLDQMNALSVAGLNWRGQKNEMVISAGDDITGMTTVFRGIIQEAYPDFSAMPDAPFFVRANPGPLAQLKPVEPTSYTGAADSKTVLQKLAQLAGFTLEYNGDSVQLSSPYFAGSAWDQIVKAVKSSNLYATIDSISNILAVWVKNGSRGGGTALISPETGMIGYPQFSQAAVIVRTVYSAKTASQLTLTKADAPSTANTTPGRKIQVQSQLTAANGTFTVAEVTHRLSSQRSGGPWEIQIVAYPKEFGTSGG